METLCELTVFILGVRVNIMYHSYHSIKTLSKIDIEVIFESRVK